MVKPVNKTGKITQVIEKCICGEATYNVKYKDYLGLLNTAEFKEDELILEKSSIHKEDNLQFIN